MILEVRQLAGVEDIIAVELVCQNENCGGTLLIDHKRNGLHTHQTCPRCSEVWWDTHLRSNVFRLLVVLSDLTQGTFHGKTPNTSTEKHVKHPPKVRLVLPGRLQDD